MSHDGAGPITGKTAVAGASAGCGAAAWDTDVGEACSVGIAASVGGADVATGDAAFAAVSSPVDMAGSWLVSAAQAVKARAKIREISR